MKSEGMSICIVTVSFVPDNQAVSIRMKYLAEAFTKKGYKVTILTSKKSKEVENFNVKTNFFAPASNKDRLYIRLLKEIVFATETFFRILTSKRQLYLITSPPFTLALFAALGCTLRGTKFILDVRDEYPEVYFSERLISPNSFIGKCLIRAETWMYKRAFLITTVTNRILHKISNKLKQGSRKAWLLRNGYADGIEPALKEHSQTASFVLMFHGNMGKFQNPKLILDLAHRCFINKKNIEFKIFGWGNNIDILQNHNIPNLNIQGELSHQEIKKIIPTVHLGFSFQKDDEIAKNSFPSKIYEFIGAGIPTLITPISEAGDFVESNQVGFQFNPEDIDGIYSKLVFLLENQNELDVLKKNALAVKDKLSRKYLSMDFVEKFTTLIEHPEKPIVLHTT